jgi:hypothetical protein
MHGLQRLKPFWLWRFVTAEAVTYKDPSVRSCGKSSHIFKKLPTGTKQFDKIADSSLPVRMDFSG